MATTKRTNTKGDRVRHHMAAAACVQANGIIAMVIVVDRNGDILATATSKERKDMNAATTLMDAAVQGMYQAINSRQKP